MKSSPAFTRRDRAFVPVVLLITAFALVARGAHDIWAATVVYGLILAVAAVFVASASLRKDAPGVSIGAVLVPVIVLVAVFWMSFRQAVNPAEAWMKAMDWTVAALLFFVALSLFRSDEAVSAAMVFVVPLILLQALVQLTQVANAFPRFPAHAAGTLINPNAVAGFHLLFLPVVVAYALTPPPGSRRGYWLAGAIAAGVGLLLSGSVWAAVCVLGAAAVWGLSPAGAAIRKRAPRAVVLAAASLVGVGLFLVWEKLAAVYGWPGVLSLSGGTSRIEWWQTGLSIFRDNVWLGIGPGNFPSAFLAFKTGGGENTLFAHSIGVSLLSETGLLGAGAFVAVLWAALSPALRNSAARGRRPFAVGALLFLVFGMAQISLEYLANLLFFVLVLAAVAAPVARKSFRAPRGVALVLVACAVVALPFVAGPFVASQAIGHGQAELRDGRVEEALRAFASAAGIDTRPADAFRGQAAALYVKRARGAAVAWEKIIAPQRQAIARNRLSAPLWFELGFYLEAKGQAKEALAAYERAAQLHRGMRGYAEEVERLQVEMARR